MNKKIVRVMLFGAGTMLLVLTLAYGNLLLRWWNGIQPLALAAIQQARAGVNRNGDWQPVIRRINGLDMALVPAGCFSMGSTDLQLVTAVDSCERFFGKGRCRFDFVQSETPAHEVCFDDPFWIGETEVTNRVYGSSSSKDMYRAANWPRETVTWQEAAQFCSAHQARLPSEAEWEYSARGPDNLIYPWGDEFDLEKLVSGRLVLADVASVPAGVSWVGAFDMSGGIAEWVEDVYAPFSGAGAANPALAAEAQQRVVRGGSWFSFAAFFVRTSHREPANPTTANSTIGFRCARDFD